MTGYGIAQEEISVDFTTVATLRCPIPEGKTLLSGGFRFFQDDDTYAGVKVIENGPWGGIYAGGIYGWVVTVKITGAGTLRTYALYAD